MRMPAILCAALLVAVSAAAASPRDKIVVNTAWLAAHLNDPDLVLLHVGDKAEYAAQHIPGARFASMQDVSISDHTGKGLMLEMPPAEDLRQRLEALGISDKSHVVVYYGKDWVSPSTRVVFTLDYAGLGDRSALLDGGMQAWIRDGHAVTDAATPDRKGSLSPLKTRPIVVDAAFVRSHLSSSGYAIVDGRASVFYDGIDVGEGHAGPHRRGHVAGAHSVPFTEITTDNVMLRTPAELEALFTKAGV